MQKLTLKVKKLNDKAFMPLKKDGDAGWDLFATEDVEIRVGDIKPVHTGIAIGIPKGYRLNIRDRSSLGVQGIHVMGGVIDQTYTGELIVCLANVNVGYMFDKLIDIMLQELGDPLFCTSYYINKGDRIAQFVLEEDPQFVSLLEVDELEETERGSKGFGSTGK